MRYQTRRTYRPEQPALFLQLFDKQKKSKVRKQKEEIGLGNFSTQGFDFLINTVNLSHTAHVKSRYTGNRQKAKKFIGI